MVAVLISLTTFLLFLSCSSTAKLNREEFKKYSYLLITTKKSKKPQKDIFDVIGLGTGFFIEKDKKILLVSANHVFTGNDPFKVIRIDSVSPDLIAIHFDNRESDPSRFYGVFTDSIKLQNPPKPFDEHPDILIYEMPLSTKGKVQTINKFINTNYKIADSDSLFFWGYPSEPQYFQQSIAKYENNKNQVLYNGKFIEERGFIYYLSPVNEFGFSGSPVFAVNKKGRISFVGVNAAGSDNWNLTHVVKYTELLKMLDRF